MFIIEEPTGPDGHGLIYLRLDGQVEGLVLRKEKIEAQGADVERNLDGYESCAVGETRESVCSIVYEAIGL